MSPMLKSTGVGSLGTKFWEDGVDRCKPNFNRIWDRRGALVQCCREHMHTDSAPYKLAVTVYRSLSGFKIISPSTVCLCLKFPLASVYDLSDVVNCLFHMFTAACLEVVLFLSPDQQSRIHCQMISCWH